jgi:hypothetical protein
MDDHINTILIEKLQRMEMIEMMIPSAIVAVVVAFDI